MPHVTFIHGILNKPEEAKLLRDWNSSLSLDQTGKDITVDLSANGISTSMIYWADVLYDKPIEIDGLESCDSMNLEQSILVKEVLDPEMEWMDKTTPLEKKLIESFTKRFDIDFRTTDRQEDDCHHKNNSNLERVPLPWFLKKKIMKSLLKDCHHYLFNIEYEPRPGIFYKVKDEIRGRVLKKLKDIKTDKHYIVSHSMGTIIMYDCLKNVEECPSIDGFLTIGSPLGIDEIQDNLKPGWSRENGYPEKLLGPWINVFDPLDPVALFDGKLSNDFKKNGQEVIEVIEESNYGIWRHSIENYLEQPKLRTALRQMINL